MATNASALLGLLNADDLSAFKQEVAAADPYSQMASIFASFKPVTAFKGPDNVIHSWTPGQSAGVSFAQSFLSNLFGDISRNNQSEQLHSVMNILPELYANPSAAKLPEGGNSSAFNALKDLAILKGQARNEVSALDAREFQQDLLKSMFGKQLDEQGANRQAALKTILENPAKAAKLERMIPGFFKSVTGQDLPFAAEDAQPVPDMPAANQSGPKLGVPSLSDIYKKNFQEKIDLGVPDVQAATAARDEANQLRAQSKELYSKPLAEEADSIAKAEDLIRKGKEGIAKAGNTGSALASKYEKAVSTLAPILPWDTSDAETKAAGDALLNQTQQLGAMLNRIKGTGALSDFETKALYSTALSPTQVPSANQAILQQYKNGLEIMKDHQSFMNYFLDATGGNPQMAQTYWDLYKKENPIVAPDGKGGYRVNENRTPWQKFDFENAYKRYLQGGASTAKSDQPNALPGVGGQFNGEKVLSVKKIS